MAFNGAEPVRPETLDRFAEAFAPAGFRREMFLPCYGLAEATLLVSGGPRAARPSSCSVDAVALGQGEVVEPGPTAPGKRLVGSGTVAAGQSGRVRRSRPPASRARRIASARSGCPARAWQRAIGDGPRRRSERLCAHRSANGDGPFLRTGDLGFLEDGELFVTGRLKDMIILRGRNIYPQDVEWTAERCHPALRAGGAAAFAVEVDGEERLAIVHEVERNRDQAAVEEIFAAVRRAVALELDIEVYAIRLIKTTSLPRTSSGKVQRHACREAFLAGSLEVVAEWTRQAWPHAGPAPSRPDPSPFQSDVTPPARPRGTRSRPGWPRRSPARWAFGPMTSTSARPWPALASARSRRCGSRPSSKSGWAASSPPTLVYDYPTIDALAGFLAGESPDGGARAAGRCRRSAVASRSRSSASAAGSRVRTGPRPSGSCCEPARRRSARSRTRAGPTQDLRGLDFPGAADSSNRSTASTRPSSGSSPREAMFLDPQQRMLLEVAWEALEDGGQVPERLAGTPVGVFIGISTNDYALHPGEARRRGDRPPRHGELAAASRPTGSRISSTSGPEPGDRHRLLVVAGGDPLRLPEHLGRRVRAGAGRRLNLLLQAQVFAGFAKSGFLSPDGHCRAFDAQANGYVRGEGAGIVVLKPLSRALADGDPIYAVIRGGAVNQDGRTNGLTAPSGPAQEAVLRAAYRHAGVAPERVDYIEAHGTGTPLGDPIELAALGAVLGEGRDAGRRCALGSVKTNIGHLEAAAGVAGLIKAALALHHRHDPRKPQFLPAESAR